MRWWRTFDVGVRPAVVEAPAPRVRCREHGVTVLHLETNHALSEAIELYRGAAFVEVAPFNDEPYAHHWFAKTLK